MTLPRALLAWGLLLLGAPATASAHATLEGSSPARGARLETAPRAVSLRFDEPVEASFGAVRVFDARGRRVDTGTRSSGATVAGTLRRGLPRGAYTATYRVISADSHPVSGGFVFSVGDGAGPAQTVAELLDRDARAGRVTRTALDAARAVQYAAIALGLGAVLFLLIVWRAVAPAAAPPFDAALRRLLAAAAGAGALSGVLGIALQGAVAGGTSLWAASSPSVVGEVLGTRLGTVWAAGVLAWGALLGLALVRRPAWALAPLGLLAFLPGLAGHAGVESPRGLMLAANVVHVVAISAWLGGVAVLLTAVRAATRALPLPERGPLLAPVVGRFSALAGVAVGLVLVSGIAQSIVEVASFGALLDTAFGRAVVIKLALLAALVALGALNRRRVLPRLRRAVAGGHPAGAAGVALRRVLRTEAAIFVGVLGVTGALASYAPSTAATTGPYSATRSIGPARLELTLEPARVGPNEVHLYLFDRADGRPFDASKELRVTAALPRRDIAPIALDPVKAGPGHYVVRGAVLAPAGRWTLAVTSRVSDFDEHTTHLDVPVR